MTPFAIGPKSGLEYVRIESHMCKKLEELELEAFPTADPEDLYDEEELLMLVEDFPEGSAIGFDGQSRLAQSFAAKARPISIRADAVNNDVRMSFCGCCDADFVNFIIRIHALKGDLW